MHDQDERTLVVSFAQDPDQTPEAREPQPDEMSDRLQPQLVREQRLSTEYRAAMVVWQLTVFYVRDVHTKAGWGDRGMLTGLFYDATQSRLTFRSNGKLTVAVGSLRVEASGGTEIAGWSRRRVGRLGGVSTQPPTSSPLTLLESTKPSPRPKRSG